MYGINKKLKELEENNKPIRVSLVGAGLMGKGLVSQLILVKGIVPSLVVSHKIDDTIEAYTLAGISREDIKIAKSLDDINTALVRQMIFGTLDEVVTNWVMKESKYELAGLTDHVHDFITQGLKIKSKN